LENGRTESNQNGWIKMGGIAVRVAINEKVKLFPKPQAAKYDLLGEPCVPGREGSRFCKKSIACVSAAHHLFKHRKRDLTRWRNGPNQNLSHKHLKKAVLLVLQCLQGIFGVDPLAPL
jgi:hypothetical protein